MRVEVKERMRERILRTEMSRAREEKRRGVSSPRLASSAAMTLTALEASSKLKTWSVVSNRPMISYNYRKSKKLIKGRKTYDILPLAHKPPLNLWRLRARSLPLPFTGPLIRVEGSWGELPGGGWRRKRRKIVRSGRL
jgi:hypothetical protein